MQSLMFLGCFVQKLSKKNLWGFRSTPPPLVKEGLSLSIDHVQRSLTLDQNFKMADHSDDCSEDSYGQQERRNEAKVTNNDMLLITYPFN